ncbi:hypothetical protein UFOVP29_39 [uncultured Caudovirales phage]|uniref:Uncharacterized protein n=1 Tax=uncultured Caudovirales phage TaxID=2100421 RepID=A0A6J5KLF5_9CAUD|nr:hypothetical protein UFOVP29_39 [uncultured Caudovirales phage]
MNEKIKPSVERMHELRETRSIGFYESRRVATQEAVLEAIQSANCIDDLKRILCTIVEENWL